MRLSVFMAAAGLLAAATTADAKPEIVTVSFLSRYFAPPLSLIPFDATFTLDLTQGVITAFPLEAGAQFVSNAPAAVSYQVGRQVFNATLDAGATYYRSSESILVSGTVDNGTGSLELYTTFDTSGYIDGSLRASFSEEILGGDTQNNYYNYDTLPGVNGGATFQPAVYHVAVIGTPEPATWTLFLTGVGAVGARLRSRRRSGEGKGTTGAHSLP